MTKPRTLALLIVVAHLIFAMWHMSLSISEVTLHPSLPSSSSCHDRNYLFCHSLHDTMSKRRLRGFCRHRNRGKYREAAERILYDKATNTRSANCRRPLDLRNVASVPCGEDSSTPKQQR